MGLGIAGESTVALVPDSRRSPHTVKSTVTRWGGAKAFNLLNVGAVMASLTHPG